VKIVREFLYEKFIEDTDPIQDMGIGLLSKYETELAKRFRWEGPEPKDRMRIRDIVSKANGNSKKENTLATTMGKLIQDTKKAYRRYLAAKNEGGANWEDTKIYLRRAGELSGIQ
jgi:hypothetical protein